MKNVNGILTPFDDAIMSPNSATEGEQGGFDLADGREATETETGKGVNYVKVKDEPKSIDKAGASIKGS